MVKTIVAITFVALIIVWVVWDRKASWNCGIHGDCGEYWFDITCTRCGYNEVCYNLDDTPERCPKCGRAMRR